MESFLEGCKTGNKDYVSTYAAGHRLPASTPCSAFEPQLETSAPDQAPLQVLIAAESHGHLWSFQANTNERADDKGGAERLRYMYLNARMGVANQHFLQPRC